MLDSFPREYIDQVLYNAMAAVYQYDQLKVHLFGMTYQDNYLLYFLRRQSPVRMSDIAAELNVHLSTASRAVDRLERRRLVSRSKDPADKRNVLVSLEEPGLALMKTSEDHSYATIKKGMHKYTPEEITAIMKAAAGLHDILGVPPLDDKPLQRLKSGKSSRISRRKLSGSK